MGLGMPTREQWLIRKIESLESQRNNINNLIGDLNRELMIYRGMPVNDQQNYGGNIHPNEKKSLNCAPVRKELYDHYPIKFEIKEII